MSKIISKILVATNEQYRKHKKTTNKSHNDLFQEMWNTYSVFGDFFNDAQLSKIKAGAEKLNVSPHDFLITAVESYIATPASKRKTTHKFTQQSNERLLQVIHHMMQHNDHAKHMDDKIFITRYSMKTYMVKNHSEFSFKGLNEEVLKRAETDLANLLDQHHKKHQLTKDHNRTVAIKKRVGKNNTNNRVVA